MSEHSIVSVNPDVAAIPISQREMIWNAMQHKSDLANLASGNPDLAMPAAVVERMQNYIGTGYARYTDYYGFQNLREQLAAKLKTEWGLTVCPEEELIMTCGVQEGLYVVMRAFLQPGDEVIIPSPHYGTFFQNTVACGAIPVLVPLKASENFLPDRERLAAAVTPKSRAIVFCNPNNPLGVVWPQASLEAIAQLAKENNLLVLVDEIYRDYVQGTPFSIGTLPGMGPRTFTFGGFSKSHLMMGLRIGFVVGPAEIMTAVKKLHYCVALCPSVLGQVAALAALECPAEELTTIRKLFTDKLEMLYKGVAQLPGVSCVPPGGGFYIFPDFSRLESDSMRLAVRLIEDAGVVTLPGTEFGAFGQGHLRLSVCAAEKEVRKGLQRLENFVHAQAH